MKKALKDPGIITSAAAAVSLAATAAWVMPAYPWAWGIMAVIVTGTLTGSIIRSRRA